MHPLPVLSPLSAIVRAARNTYLHIAASRVSLYPWLAQKYGEGCTPRDFLKGGTRGLRWMLSVIMVAIVI